MVICPPPKKPLEVSDPRPELKGFWVSGILMRLSEGTFLSTFPLLSTLRVTA